MNGGLKNEFDSMLFFEAHFLIKTETESISNISCCLQQRQFPNFGEKITIEIDLIILNSLYLFLTTDMYT